MTTYSDEYKVSIALSDSGKVIVNFSKITTGEELLVKMNLHGYDISIDLEKLKRKDIDYLRNFLVDILKKKTTKDIMDDDANKVIQYAIESGYDDFVLRVSDEKIREHEDLLELIYIAIGLKTHYPPILVVITIKDIDEVLREYEEETKYLFPLITISPNNLPKISSNLTGINILLIPEDQSQNLQEIIKKVIKNGFKKLSFESIKEAVKFVIDKGFEELYSLEGKFKFISEYFIKLIGLETFLDKVASNLKKILLVRDNYAVEAGVEKIPSEGELKIIFITGPPAEFRWSGATYLLKKAGKSSVVKELIGYLLKIGKSVLVFDFDYPRLINELLLYKPRSIYDVKTPLVTLLMHTTGKLNIMNLINEVIIPGAALKVVKDNLKKLGIKDERSLERKLRAVRLLPSFSFIRENLQAYLEFLSTLDNQERVSNYIVEIISQLRDEIDYVVFDVAPGVEIIEIINKVIEKCNEKKLGKTEVWIIFPMPDNDAQLNDLNMICNVLAQSYPQLNPNNGYVILKGTSQRYGETFNIRPMCSKISKKNGIRNYISKLIPNWNGRCYFLPFIPFNVWVVATLSFFGLYDDAWNNVFKNLGIK